MKTLELEPLLVGAKVTFDLPPEAAAAIAAHPGSKLRLAIPGMDEAWLVMPNPGDGVDAWRRYRDACGTPSMSFRRSRRSRGTAPKPTFAAGLRIRGPSRL